VNPRCPPKPDEVLLVWIRMNRPGGGRTQPAAFHDPGGGSTGAVLTKLDGDRPWRCRPFDPPGESGLPRSKVHRNRRSKVRGPAALPTRSGMASRILGMGCGSTLRGGKSQQGAWKLADVEKMASKKAAGKPPSTSPISFQADADIQTDGLPGWPIEDDFPGMNKDRRRIASSRAESQLNASKAMIGSMDRGERQSKKTPAPRGPTLQAAGRIFCRRAKGPPPGARVGETRCSADFQEKIWRGD